jgi:hypothetical protein
MVTDSFHRMGREVDPTILSLVNALNAYAAITTIGSCGGHAEPGPGQWPAGSWYVKFDIEQSPEGWMTVEFLAWAINNAYVRSDAGHTVVFEPTAPPPYLNGPGEVLRWVVEGYQNEDPDALARYLVELIDDYYVPAEVVRKDRAATARRRGVPRCVRRRLGYEL